MAELERLEEHRARIEDWLHKVYMNCPVKYISIA